MAGKQRRPSISRTVARSVDREDVARQNVPLLSGRLDSHSTGWIGLVGSGRQPRDRECSGDRSGESDIGEPAEPVDGAVAEEQDADHRRDADLSDDEHGGDGVDRPELQCDGLDVERDRTGDRDRPGSRVGEQGRDIERVNAVEDTHRHRQCAVHRAGERPRQDGAGSSEEMHDDEPHQGDGRRHDEQRPVKRHVVRGRGFVRCRRAEHAERRDHHAHREKVPTPQFCAEQDAAEQRGDDQVPGDDGLGEEQR
ncbi:hypothetical protein SAMN04488548_134139 [Gordonia westfalica]|uniref:Uncharacterized protein n=1 Tax=Gordonia westfalica TaxID=158898 RepID=A0A1H2GW38_9ACTN|nr:hypothetical protein SAMN04488548_134139 [Gordonia westfalica]